MSRFLFYLCLGVILAVVVLVAWQKIADLMDQGPQPVARPSPPARDGLNDLAIGTLFRYGGDKQQGFVR